MKLWVVPFGLLAAGCAYGFWCSPLKPWVLKQYEDACWLWDQLRLKHKYGLEPVMGGGLTEFSRILDNLPDPLKGPADEFFLDVFPEIQALDVYRKEEWEYVG